MTTLAKIAAAGTLLLPFLQVPAPQPSPASVHLSVIHSGRQRPAPAEITASFDGRSVRIPLRDGEFQVPPEVVAAESVTVETDVENSHIRLTGVHGWAFTCEHWTLRLAERANPDWYFWRGPKRADIPSTCMLGFDSIRLEPPRGLFREHCRSTKK
jgi:hypothetical protein